MKYCQTAFANLRNNHALSTCYMYVFALSFNWFTGFVASYLLLLKNFKEKLSKEKYKEKNGGYR